MHSVFLINGIDTPRWKLPKGKYVMEDLSAFELSIDADRGTAIVEPFESPVHVATSNTLLIANGGYGDALMLIPALRGHRAMYPFHRLVVSMRSRVHPIFDGLDLGVEFVDYPVPLEYALNFHRVLTTEHIQEASEEGKTTPAVDLKAKLLGVGPLTGDARKTAYVVTETERNWANALYPSFNRKRVGVQVRSSSPTRDYHAQHMSVVFSSLYESGREVIILGAPGSVPESAIPENKRDLIKNATIHNPTFRQSVAIASTCDCLLTMDSSFCHIAGALSIPCVSLFGSTHWKLRSADYATVTAIQGHGSCGPCWHHPKSHEIFPRKEKCSTMGYCGLINQIPPERVVASIEKKLTTKPALVSNP